jgi:hypothetical protein
MRETKKVKAAWREIEEKMMVENRHGDLRRARSVTVGTAFGGTTELMMRGNDGNVIWAIMQPVEVVELIHQLSANIGCHIHMQPRNDFASWRNWRVSPEEKLHLNGHPPFVNDMAPHMAVGANLPPPEQQPGLQPALMAKETQDEQAVAIEKTLKRRSTKRTAKTA